MTREDLVPPFRFALLAASPYPPTSSSSSTSTSTSTSALYRGSLPLPHHVPFLSSLNLKTIISLTPKPLTIYEEERIASPLKRRKIDIEKGEVEEELVSIWCKRRGINIIHIKSDKSKDGSIPFNPTTVKKVLEVRLFFFFRFASFVDYLSRMLISRILIANDNRRESTDIYSRLRWIRRLRNNRSFSTKTDELERNFLY